MTPSIGVTLDAGGLIAVDRGVLATLALIRLARQTGTKVVDLDHADAIAVGRILALTRTADIADAHVVLCARRVGQAVMTSDAADLRRLDPSLRLVEI